VTPPVDGTHRPLRILFSVPMERGDRRASRFWLEPLTAALPDAEILIPAELSDPAAIDYALVWKPAPGLLGSLPNLRAVFSLGAGVDGILADPTFPREVPLVRLIDDGLTRGMTEWVVLQVLFHHRKMGLFLQQQRAAEWRVQLAVPAARTRIGVMGLGVLGRDAATALQGLGYDVAGWSRTPKDAAFATFAGEAGLGPFLARTEILVCLLPLTDATRGILNSALFDRLPRGAIIVNAGRGAHLVEPDLLGALDSGQIGGASLDVFATEPLPPAHPFWQHPRIVITPHCASITDPHAIAARMAENIARDRSGAAMVGVVDVARGY